MIGRSLLRDLGRIVGDRFVTANTVASEAYSYDASMDVSRPGVVVFPGSTAETAAVVKALTAAGIPRVARGFGTNLSGGSIPLQSAGVIALSRLNRIVDITPQRRIARVECGVTNLEVQNALSPLGYFYAPDPASQKVASLTYSEVIVFVQLVAVFATMSCLCGLSSARAAQHPTNAGHPSRKCASISASPEIRSIDE